LGVRVQVLRDNATCEIQLDDRAMFYPSDAALASWMAQAHERQAAIVYEENRGG
jgi:DNA polymerase-3 subunit alpha